jgi:AcrR family transcriptional regulator
LVNAATKLLVTTHALPPPSLRAIARECNVSPAAVYLHFKSQTQLLTAVLETQFAQLRHTLDQADDPAATPLDRLHAMAHRYVTWGIDHPGAYQLLFETADPPLAADTTGPGVGLLHRAAALAPHAPDGDIAWIFAMRLWTSLHGLTSLRIHKPTAPWATDIGADTSALVNAIVAAEPRPGPWTPPRHAGRALLHDIGGNW